MTTIYGDWGTTRLRLWQVENGTVTASREGPGIGSLSEAPADVLRTAVAPWIASATPTEIVLCGMVGARNGLHEVVYADCPTDAVAWRNAAADLTFDGMPLRIMAGVACREHGRSDVMRGEETQIFGATRLQPELREGLQVAVLPGTHSKWVRLDGGRIAAFRTFLTGELYMLLQGSSLLATSRNTGPGPTDEGFTAGLARADEPGGPLGSLFEARAAQLRDGRDADWASGFISGLLLGSELDEMRRLGPLPGRVSVIGGAALAARYAQAFTHFGVEAAPLDGEACALAGLELSNADD